MLLSLLCEEVKTFGHLLKTLSEYTCGRKEGDSLVVRGYDCVKNHMMYMEIR